MSKRILVYNPKGGVGKTVICALATEWFLYRGRSVNLVDGDGNLSSTEWIANCREAGREILATGVAEIEIVDTKGATGSAVPFLRHSDLILTPFQSYGYDVSEVIEMVYALAAPLRAKVGLVPNRVRALGLTREQSDGLAQITKLIEDVGAGTLLPGLVDRIAVYPDLFNGSKLNFFERQDRSAVSVENAQREAGALFVEVERLLGLEGKPR